MQSKTFLQKKPHKKQKTKPTCLIILFARIFVCIYRRQKGNTENFDLLHTFKLHSPPRIHTLGSEYATSLYLSCNHGSGAVLAWVLAVLLRH